jgi:predicted SAM-dependent methyltransferase
MTFSINATLKRLSRLKKFSESERICLVYSAFIRNRKNFANIKSEGAVLDIGCGFNPHPQNINLDYTWHPGVDICWDITRGLPLPDNYLGGVFSEHCLEHIELQYGVGLIREIHRCLQPGARVRIVMPDLEQFLDHYVQIRATGDGKMPPDGSDGDGTLWTPAVSINNIMRTHGHRFIYDFETLKLTLHNAGFVDVVKASYGAGFDQKLLLDTEQREFGSMYVEARKASVTE